MSLLDLLGVNRIFKAGQPVDPTRKILNFIGDGVTIVDNPGSLRTDITIAAGGGGGGEGTVGGPDTSTAGNVAVWAGVDGTELADGGRSVATDGAKLDGIEAGAQVTSFARVASALAAATADVAINAHKLTGVANPTSAQDAATKAYVDASASWTTAVETNFETVPAASLVNGANTVDGHVWQGVNFASAASVAVGAAAAGLAIANSTANTDYSAAARTAPLVTHPLTDSIPGFTAGTHELRLYGLIATNAARNYEYTRFGLETVPPTTSFRSYWLYSLAFNNAPTNPAHHYYSGASEGAVTMRTTLTNTAVCLIRDRSGVVYIYSKNVGTVLATDPADSLFTDDLSTWELDAVVPTTTAIIELGGGRRITNAASLTIVFASMNANAAGLLVSRLRRVRLQWRKR